MLNSFSENLMEDNGSFTKWAFWIMIVPKHWRQMKQGRVMSKWQWTKIHSVFGYHNDKLMFWFLRIFIYIISILHSHKECQTQRKLNLGLANIQYTYNTLFSFNTFSLFTLPMERMQHSCKSSSATKRHVTIATMQWPIKCTCMFTEVTFFIQAKW